MQTNKKPGIIVDAEGLILGRLCSQVAKRLLIGEQVTIINAEKAVLSGRRKSKVAEAKQFLEVGAPERGPFHYRRPDRIMLKTVRGMLPMKQVKGQRAIANLRVFMSVPQELRDQKTEKFIYADASKLKGPQFTLAELAREIGWNQGE
ncbi:MAG: 50S ribosomal protein L13 [Chloroflexota bacterium]